MFLCGVFVPRSTIHKVPALSVFRMLESLDTNFAPKVFRDPVLLVRVVFVVFWLPKLLLLPTLAVFQDFTFRGAAVLAVLIWVLFGGIRRLQVFR